MDQDRYIKLRDNIKKKYGAKVQIRDQTYCTGKGDVRISYQHSPYTFNIDKIRKIFNKLNTCFKTPPWHPYIYIPKNEDHAKKMWYEYNNNCVVSNKPYKYKVEVGIKKWSTEHHKECDRIKQLFNYERKSEFHEFSKQFMNSSRIDKTVVYVKDDENFDMLKFTLQMFEFYGILSCKEIHRSYGNDTT